MALTQNQFDTVFLKLLGRAPTPYEYQKYSNAGADSLNSLPAQYSRLNIQGSVADLAQFQGHDPSQLGSLAQQYGIQNYSATPEQNKQLHDYLSGRATYTPPQSQPTQGSLQTLADSTRTQNGTLSDAADAFKNSNDAGVQDPNAGSVSAAAIAPPQKSPVMQDTLNNYQGVQKQIAQIDSALANAFDQKRAQVAQSGGIVNEAQLMGMVQAEQQPLLAQRRELASLQSQYGSQYQAMLKDYNTQLQQYNKDRSVDEKQREFDITANQRQENIDINARKAAQANYKLSTVPTYDAYGNRVGSKIVRTKLMPDGTTQETPLPTDKNGALTPASVKEISSGPVGDPSTKSAAHIQDTSSPAYVASFKTNGDAPTDTNQGIKVPGTTLTLGSLYQSALDWMAKSQTTTSTRSGKTIVINTNAAIQAKGAAILQKLGVSKLDYEAAFKANSQALGNTMKQFALLQVNEQSAKYNFNKLLQLSRKVDQTTYRAATPMIERWIQTGQVQLGGNADVNNYVSQLVLTMTEYAKVVTGQTSGASVTDRAATETQKLLDSGLSTAALQSYVDNVATPDIDNRAQSYGDSVRNLTTGIETGKVGVESKPTSQTSQPIVTPDDYSSWLKSNGL